MIEADLIRYLLRLPTVKALVGDRIQSKTHKVKFIGDYVTVELMPDRESLDTHDSDAVMVNSSFDIRAWSQDKDKAKAIGNAIRSVLFYDASTKLERRWIPDESESDEFKSWVEDGYVDAFYPQHDEDASRDAMVIEITIMHEEKTA